MNSKWLEIINASEMPFSEIKKACETPLPPIEPQDLAGKVVIITGANTGIGYETAKSIASMNPKKLILACRNIEKGNAALESIKAATKIGSQIELWSLDLASFASVQAFTDKFLQTGWPLDILVSNAGLGASQEWVITDDGYEITTQVNHIANVLLVSNLHPALKLSSDSKKDHSDHFPRVNIVASDVHYWATIPLPEDPQPVNTALQKPEDFSPLSIYTTTKLFNVLFAKAYAKKCPDPVWICSSNPSYTVSELGTKNPKSGEPLDVNRPTHMTPRPTYEGAKTIIHASISPKVGESGKYYSDMQEFRTRSSANGEIGEKFAENVWKNTIEILKKHVPSTPIYSW